MAMRYDAGAAAYDQLTGRWSKLYADAALAAVGARPGDRLLDVATGKADMALRIRQNLDDAGTNFGVDISMPMLRAAGTKAGGSNVALVAADATRLPFSNESFRCVTCLFWLMFFRTR